MSSCLCPHCVAVAHVRNLKQRFPDKSVSAYPLFPDERGLPVSKAKMIESAANVAASVGVAPRNTRGAPRWGGHLFRRGGSQAWYQLGISVRDLGTHARHSISAILLYIEEAEPPPITNLRTNRSFAGETGSAT